MKLIITAFILSFSCISMNISASSFSIKPSKKVTGLFKIASKKKVAQKGIRVSGVSYLQNSEEYTAYGKSFYVTESVFDLATSLAKGNYRATPGDSTSSFGTAFHVGGNLVLTSQHVLSVSRANTKECKRFSIRLNSNQKDKILKCKKVHYCHRNLDFCLIEMQDH